MGLKQQLAAFEAEFTRTAPAGQVALASKDVAHRNRLEPDAVLAGLRSAAA